MWPLVPSRNVAPMFYQLICTLFGDKNKNGNGNLARNNIIDFYYKRSIKQWKKH